jgi:hypothetical protein
MNRLECNFYALQKDQPSIWASEILEEGPDFIEFDGRFHAEDFPLPYIMILYEMETTPYLVEDGTSHYRMVRSIKQDIEVIRREILEDTSVISEIVEDGEPMSICFTPTCRQRIWFKVTGNVQVLV